MISVAADLNDQYSGWSGRILKNLYHKKHSRLKCPSLLYSAVFVHRSLLFSLSPFISVSFPFALYTETYLTRKNYSLNSKCFWRYNCRRMGTRLYFYFFFFLLCDREWKLVCVNVKMIWAQRCMTKIRHRTLTPTVLFSPLFLISNSTV